MSSYVIVYILYSSITRCISLDNLNTYKGTVSKIKSTPVWKIEILNLQRYPWNRNLIKTVEDNVVFGLKKRIPNSYLIRQIIQGYRTL